MNKKIPELLIIFALFVSPLVHSSIENSFFTRRMWSWCLLISIAIIVFFSTYPFRVQKILSYSIATCGTLIISSFLLATYPVNALGIYVVALVLCVALALHIIVQNNQKYIARFTVLVLACITLYAQWGIAQFIVQHDIGMHKLGESVLHQNTPGVASFYIGSDKFIRAYGPFSHANSFGGVLLIGVILLYKLTDRLHNRLFTNSVFFLLSLGIVVSFSRTALIGLVILSALYVHKKRDILLLPTLCVLLLFGSLIAYRSFDSQGVAAHDRLVGFSWFWQSTSAEQLVRGTGIGNYTSSLTAYLQRKAIDHNSWDRAPIHSVPLLLIAELGLLICLPIFILLTKYVYQNKLWLLAVLLPALILDHYFATQMSPAIFLITSAQLVVQ